MKRITLVIIVMAALTSSTTFGQLSVTVNDASICSGSSATLTAVVTGGTQPYTYHWSSGQTINPITVNPSSTITYTIVVTDNASVKDTAYAAVIVNAAVPAQPGVITGPSTPCFGSTQTYCVTNVPGTTYSWTVPIGWNITSGQNTNCVTAYTAASGLISVTPSNGCGLGTSQVFTVTLATQPGQPSPITGVTDPCEGSTQTYCVTDVPGTSYTWSIPATWTLISGQGANCVTFIVGSNNFTVILMVSPDNTCGPGIARNASINVILNPPMPSNIMGPTNPCQGSTQTYSVNNVSGVYFNWSVPTDWTIISGQGTHSITVIVGTNAGTISVYGTNACENGPTKFLGVTTKIVPGQPSAITGPSNPSPGSTANFCVTNSTGVTYTWTVPADWTIVSGQDSNCITVTIGNMSGDIMVTPYLNGCSGPAQTLYMTITATQELAGNPGDNIEIIPNPANDEVNIAYNAETAKSLQIEIFNFTGQTVNCVRTEQFAGRFTTSIDLRDLSDGVYFIQVSTGQTSWLKKLVVIR